MKLWSITSRVSKWPITAHHMQENTFRNRTRSTGKSWLSKVKTWFKYDISLRPLTWSELTSREAPRWKIQPMTHSCRSERRHSQPLRPDRHRYTASMSSRRHGLQVTATQRSQALYNKYTPTGIQRTKNTIHCDSKKETLYSCPYLC